VIFQQQKYAKMLMKQPIVAEIIFFVKGKKHGLRYHCVLETLGSSLAPHFS